MKSIRFCQNIKHSRHTSASSAAHSLGNTDLDYTLHNLFICRLLIVNAMFYLQLAAGAILAKKHRYKLTRLQAIPSTTSCLYKLSSHHISEFENIFQLF